MAIDEADYAPGKSKKPHRTIACSACGYRGRVLRAHHGYKWWMLPAALACAFTGIGLIPFIWYGNRTSERCANCKSLEFAPTSGNLWPTSYDIWKKAHAADD